MLMPNHSVLVLVDAPIYGYTPVIERELMRLLMCARALCIPILCATYDSGVSVGLTGAQHFVGTECPRVPFEPEAEVWQSTPLANALLATGRRQLLICGYWLEDSVSLLAHHAMRAGLDPYVTIDAAPARHPNHVLTLQMRLVQHNVVVTTSEQAVREWVALATGENKRAAAQLVQAASGCL